MTLGIATLTSFDWLTSFEMLRNISVNCIRSDDFAEIDGVDVDVDEVTGTDDSVFEGTKFFNASSYFSPVIFGSSIGI